MGAGRLDRRIRLQRLVTARDAAGAETQTWSDVGPAWAEYKPEVGTEDFQSDQRTAPMRAVFTIRHRSGLEPGKTAVVYQERTWDVEGVRELDRKGFLALDCRAREVGT